jgi:hypothetical protein
MGLKTTVLVHENCTKNKDYTYCLTVSESSIIQLVHPLSKETVLKNNHHREKNRGASKNYDILHFSFDPIFLFFK